MKFPEFCVLLAVVGVVVSCALFLFMYDVHSTFGMPIPLVCSAPRSLSLFLYLLLTPARFLLSFGSSAFIYLY